MCKKLEEAIEAVYAYSDEKGHTVGLGRYLVMQYGSPTAADVLLVTEGDHDIPLSSWYGTIPPKTLFRAMDRCARNRVAIHPDTYAYVSKRLMYEVRAPELTGLLPALKKYFGEMFQFLEEAMLEGESWL